MNWTLWSFADVFVGNVSLSQLCVLLSANNLKQTANDVALSERKSEKLLESPKSREHGFHQRLSDPAILLLRNRRSMKKLYSAFSPHPNIDFRFIGLKITMGTHMPDMDKGWYDQLQWMLHSGTSKRMRKWRLTLSRLTDCDKFDCNKSLILYNIDVYHE